MLYYVISKKDNCYERFGEIIKDMCNLCEYVNNKEEMEEFKSDYEEMDKDDINFYNFDKMLRKFPADLDVDTTVIDDDSTAYFIYLDEKAKIDMLFDPNDKKRLSVIEDIENELEDEVKNKVQNKIEKRLIVLKILYDKGCFTFKNLSTLTDLINGVNDEEIIERNLYFALKKPTLKESIEYMMKYSVKDYLIEEITDEDLKKKFLAIVI